jgi:hypothetical protein
MQNDKKCGIVCKDCGSMFEHSQIARIRSETDNFPQTCTAVICNSGTTARQRPKNLFPAIAVCLEGVCVAQIYHGGSFPVAAIN